MITFDSLTLKAFINENIKFLTGARIQKIQQPTRKDFLFTIRNNTQSKKLYININPQYHHLCFLSKENEEKRLIDIPQKPPMFCMLLRKYLENAKICNVKQPPYERILEFYIETYNELSEKIYLCLAIELMGKHSNVILYNDDTNVIIGCAHNVGAEKSSIREMAGTLPYVYPPKQIKNDILNYNGEIDYEKLSDEFFWFSKSFAKQCKNIPLQTLKNYINLINISPVISKDYKEFCLFKELIEPAILQDSVNSMIDNYFTYYQVKEKYNLLKTHLIAETNQKLKKILNSIQKINKQIIHDAQYDKYRLLGDLIMANLYNNKDYSSNISVFDYENGHTITIELDENKTLKENANKFYKLYNKGKTSKLKLTEMIDKLNENKTYYEQVLYSINCAKNIKELLEIKNELEPEKINNKEKKTAIEPIKIKDGDYTIFIGKNNKQNDYIISKLAQDDDLWFHTRNCAGSHILLKGKNPTNEIILKCAKLAKINSSASDSSKVGVIYTKRKFIKKPPKANLGYVTYKEEQEIIID